jgi:hypothetical protein
LTKLFVESIEISRNDEGRPKVDVTYRFGPPESANGVHDSEEESAQAHGRGGEAGLLRSHPKVTAYEVVVERDKYYGTD